METWHVVACRPGGDAAQELQDKVIELEEQLASLQVDQERCVLAMVVVADITRVSQTDCT